MTTPEKIQKFANMLAAPDGTAWVRIEEKQNKKTWRGGGTSEWLSYDVQMLYIKAGKLMEFLDICLGDCKVSIPKATIYELRLALAKYE